MARQKASSRSSLNLRATKVETNKSEAAIGLAVVPKQGWLKAWDYFDTDCSDCSD